ncbi:MAG: type II toxin-antitoxin system RelE/ParE family toxin, partial [Thiothrix sp.]|nr:type II toxin-antitoxin system RelE/ParE family toxin [Thiothrix sp.]
TERKANKLTHQVGQFYWPKVGQNRWPLTLSDNPKLGRDFSFVKAHARRSNCGHHAVYYQIMSKRDVLILRVLHQKMDPARHLPS